MRMRGDEEINFAMPRVSFLERLASVAPTTHPIDSQSLRQRFHIIVAVVVRRGNAALLVLTLPKFSPGLSNVTDGGVLYYSHQARHDPNVQRLECQLPAKDPEG